MKTSGMILPIGMALTLLVLVILNAIYWSKENGYKARIALLKVSEMTKKDAEFLYMDKSDGTFFIDSNEKVYQVIFNKDKKRTVKYVVSDGDIIYKK